MEFAEIVNDLGSSEIYGISELLGDGIYFSLKPAFRMIFGMTQHRRPKRNGKGKRQNMTVRTLVYFRQIIMILLKPMSDQVYYVPILQWPRDADDHVQTCIEYQTPGQTKYEIFAVSISTCYVERDKRDGAYKHGRKVAPWKNMLIRRGRGSV